MSALYALYSDPGQAQCAVDRLKEVGIEEKDITIVSSAPIDGQDFARRDESTWMPKIAVVGGAVGLIVAYFLTSLTQKAWPLVTGGMPIVSLYANMVPLFELTMLGAVLGTVVTLFVTAKLGRSGKEIYDPEVSSGKILIGIAAPKMESVAAVEQALVDSGRVELKRI